MKTRFLRRIICLILTLCTVLSIFPVTAFATQEHISEIHSNRIEEDCNIYDAKLMQEGSKVTATEIYNALSTLAYKSDLLAAQSNTGKVYALTLCLAHKWGSWSTIRSATCTSTGQKVRYCTKCGKANYETLSALGHSVNSYPSVTVAPTCTAQGYCTYRCRRCSIDMSTLYTPAKGHSWGSYSVTRPATCTTTGEKRRACIQCKTYDYSVTIPALGHSKSSSPSVTIKETCTTQGYSLYNCVRCKTTMEKIYTPAPGHSYGAYTTDKEPTCTKTGSEVSECSRCGHEDTRIIAKLPHEYYSEKERVVSGCVIEDYTYKKCRTCPTIFDEKVVVTANHDTRTRQHKPATCIEPEVIEVYCCKCYAHIRYFDGDPALDGHVPDYSRGKVVLQEATCEQFGLIQQWCKNCEKQINTSTGKKDHKPGKWDELEVSTCLKAGKRETTCTVCGVTYQEVTANTADKHIEENFWHIDCTANTYTDLENVGATGGYVTEVLDEFFLCERCNLKVPYNIAYNVVSEEKHEKLANMILERFKSPDINILNCEIPDAMNGGTLTAAFQRDGYVVVEKKVPHQILFGVGDNMSFKCSGYWNKTDMRKFVRFYITSDAFKNEFENADTDSIVEFITKCEITATLLRGKISERDDCPKELAKILNDENATIEELIEILGSNSTSEAVKQFFTEVIIEIIVEILPQCVSKVLTALSCVSSFIKLCEAAGNGGISPDGSEQKEGTYPVNIGLYEEIRLAYKFKSGKWNVVGITNKVYCVIIPIFGMIDNNLLYTAAQFYDDTLYLGVDELIERSEQGDGVSIIRAVDVTTGMINTALENHGINIMIPLKNKEACGGDSLYDKMFGGIGTSAVLIEATMK